MRRLPVLSTLLCLFSTLLAAGGTAVAAVDYVPRMERVAACSWDRPGHNPFMGDVVAAVDRYSDIPTAVRVRLKQRMQARQYDDFVDIRRDSISGREAYEPTIRDMHFGLDRVCRQVTRERWSAQMHERGVVYCEQEHCILVPTVCRNVSRIHRRPAAVAGESDRGTGAPETTGSSTSANAGGQGDAASERPAGSDPAERGPGITSSFAEAVAGATIPLWPTGGDDGATPRDEGGGGTGGGGPTPWLSTPVGGGSPFAPGSGSPGGSGGPDDGNGGNGGSGGSGGEPGVIGGGGGSGGEPGVIGGGGGGGDGIGGGGAPGFPVVDPAPPVSPIPEPATWASLLAGLAALALVSARRRRQD